MALKTCSTCRTPKETTEFTKDRQRKDGLRPSCRGCKAQKDKEFRASNPERFHNGTLKNRYGITYEHYNFMVGQQKGLCAICGEAETIWDKRTGAPRSLSVDHDHVTGQVRGLLCHACNMTLGLVQDDVERLQKAIQYLVTHGGESDS